MKMKISDAIRKSTDEDMAKIIGSLIVCQAYGIEAADAVKMDYKNTYYALQREIDVPADTDREINGQKGEEGKRMERFTIEKCGDLLIKNGDKEFRSPCLGCENIDFCKPEKDMTCDLYKAILKLKEHEDLEEQGLLLKLPCKVGDTVYAYCSEFGILPYEVDCIVIDKDLTYRCSSYSAPIGDCPSECVDEIEPDISEFGKTVFLTQAEAEQKLEELSS